MSEPSLSSTGIEAAVERENIGQRFCYEELENGWWRGGYRKGVSGGWFGYEGKERGGAEQHTEILILTYYFLVLDLFFFFFLLLLPSSPKEEKIKERNVERGHVYPFFNLLLVLSPLSNPAGHPHPKIRPQNFQKRLFLSIAAYATRFVV